MKTKHIIQRGDIRLGSLLLDTIPDYMGEIVKDNLYVITVSEEHGNTQYNYARCLIDSSRDIIIQFDKRSDHAPHWKVLSF